MIRFTNRDPRSPVECSFSVQSVLFRERSEFQEVLVVENPFFGRMLILDGGVQMTTRDEFLYHEMLVHVAMQAHSAPASVAVIGGGDGGAVREVLKHECVRSVQVAEIDETVVRAVKQCFPDAARALEDDRVQLHVLDGTEFVRVPDMSFDVMVVDAGDITGYEGSLYTEDFFQACFDRLNEDGILVTHTGSLHFDSGRVRDVQARLKEVFPQVTLFTSSIPSYGGAWWTFSAASKKFDLKKPARPCRFEARYYADDVHTAAFLPESLYSRLMEDRLGW